MPTHRGFSAWVVSGGAVCEENMVAVDSNANMVQCWIPSEAGETFAVFWQDHGSKVDSCAYIWLDGFLVPGRFLFGDGVASREGVRTGPTTQSPFMFSKIEDTNTGTPSKDMNPDGGTIRLEIKHITRQGQTPNNDIQQLPHHNRDKQAVGQLRIGYGEESSTWQQSPNTWDFQPVETHVTFVFRYRSPEFLLEQGIMTRISRADVPKPKTKRISAPHPSSVPIPNTITPDRQPMVPVLPVQGSSGYPPYPELWPDKTSRAQQLPHVENPPAQRPSSHQTPLEGAPVTPSPSPSPKTGKSGVNRLSAGMKKAFYPGMGGLGRMRSKDHARTVSSRASNNSSWQGLISFSDTESGQPTVFATADPAKLDHSNEEPQDSAPKDYYPNVEYYS